MTHLHKALLMFAVALVASAAHAETNEIDAKLTFAGEAGGLYHPDALQPGGAWTVFPRVGLRASYGMSNWFDLGVGLEFAIPSQVKVTVDNFADNGRGQLTADYYDFTVPVLAMFRWERGRSISWWGTLAGGIIASHWSVLSMRESQRHGFGLELPSDLEATWHTDPFLRAEVGIAWRPSDWFSLSVAPYVTRAWGGSVYAGLGGAVDLLAGVGSRG